MKWCARTAGSTTAPQRSIIPQADEIFTFWYRNLLWSSTHPMSCASGGGWNQDLCRSLETWLKEVEGLQLLCSVMAGLQWSAVDGLQQRRKHGPPAASSDCWVGFSVSTAYMDGGILDTDCTGWLCHSAQLSAQTLHPGYTLVKTCSLDVKTALIFFFLLNSSRRTI